MSRFTRSVANFPKCPTTSSDLLIVCCDGEFAVHQLLLRVHSEFINKLLNTSSQQADLVVILPDHSIGEVEKLGRIMYGVEEQGYVSESLLVALDLLQFVVFDVHVSSNSIESITFGSFISISEVNDQNLLGDLENSVEVDSSPGVENSSLAEMNLLVEDNSQVDEQNPTAENITAVENDPAAQPNPAVQYDPAVANDPAAKDDPAVDNTNITAENEPSETTKPRFECGACNGYFKTKKTLKNHRLLKHSNNSEIVRKAKQISVDKSLNRQCLLCDQMCTSRNIKKHIKTMHPEQPWQAICLVCDKIFPSMSHLNRHIKNIHYDDRCFKCTICGFRAKRNEHLQGHMKVHDGDKDFRCDNCEFITTRRRDLKKHKCIPKNYCCEVCGKRSASQDALRKHRKVIFVTQTQNIYFLAFMTLFFSFFFNRLCVTKISQRSHS